MNSFAACVFLALVGLSAATTYSYPRGCIYANGRCVQECPVGTLSYTIDCGFVTREATCAESRPKPDTKQTCGYSACHCVHPTVRNEKTGQCVHLDHCPNAKIIKTHGGGGKIKIEQRPVPARTPVPAQVAPTRPVAPTLPVAPTKPIVSSPVQYPAASNNGYNTGYNAAYNNGYNAAYNNGYKY